MTNNNLEETFKNLREHQLKAVKALEKVDEVCKQNNIDYFLIAGSTLGAIRHKGFIPWDDDVDIGMTIPNYNRFIKIIESNLPQEFKWDHTDVNPKFATLSGRIYTDDEMLVTVFPIIKLSNEPFWSKTQWLIRKIMSPVYQRKVGFKVPKEKRVKKDVIAYIISSVMACFITKKCTLKIIRWNETRFESENTSWYINLYSKYSMEKEKIKSDWIKSIKRVEFEGGSYPIFEDYDAYLKHLYGDYMKLPPKEQQVPAHM